MQNIESLFPFLLLLLVALIKKRGGEKKKREQPTPIAVHERFPSPPRPLPVRPSQPRAHLRARPKPTNEKKALVVAPDKKRSKPRITGIVRQLKKRSNIIILSEILVNKWSDK